MAKKRANGEGNIRKRADGRWEGRYTAGYRHPATIPHRHTAPTHAHAGIAGRAW